VRDALLKLGHTGGRMDSRDPPGTPPANQEHSDDLSITNILSQPYGVTIDASWPNLPESL
jgi:hypothetical protein